MVKKAQAARKAYVPEQLKAAVEAYNKACTEAAAVGKQAPSLAKYATRYSIPWQTLKDHTWGIKGSVREGVKDGVVERVGAGPPTVLPKEAEAQLADWVS